MGTATRTIAVVAHREKTLGGGLGELRDTLRTLMRWMHAHVLDPDGRPEPLRKRDGF